MQKIYKRPGAYILIGHQGEHKARQICIDISAWMDIYGSEGDVELIYQRPGDDAPYPIPVEREGDCVLWTITNTDTEKAGAGRAELRYSIGDTLVKSSTSITNVSPALDVPDTVPDPPGQSWLDQVLEAGKKRNEFVALATGTAIAANTDLDTVLTFGNYKCTAPGTVKTLLNCPVDVPFIMRVGSPAPDVPNYYYQEIITLQGVRHYRYSPDPSKKVLWTKWRQSFESGENISSDLGEAAHLEACRKFVDKMNDFAEDIGMNNTMFKTPSGLCRKTVNSSKASFDTNYNSYTTARDLLRLMVAARHTPTVFRAMGSDRCTSFINREVRHAEHGILGNDGWKAWASEHGYTILAVKGGSLKEDRGEIGTDGILNNVCLIQSGEDIYAVAVIGLTHDENETLRTLIHDLIGVAKGGEETAAIREAKTRNYPAKPNHPVGMAVAKLTSGCFDDDIAALENGIYDTGDVIHAAASTSKIMNALLVTRYMSNHKCSVNYDDLVGGSGITFAVGDEISTTDAMNLMLAVSDNAMATMLARVCGTRMAELADVPDGGGADLDGYATEQYVKDYAQPAGDYALKTEIPNVPVQSVNGKTGAVNLSASDVSALPSTTKIPAKTSELANDSGFITDYTETDPTVPSWAKQPTKPTYTASEVGALPAGTKIPSKTSDLTNDSGFLTHSTLTQVIETVPDYVVTEAMSVLDKVINAQGSRTFVLGAITDMHYGSSDYTDGVLHACQGMNHIAERIKLDALAVLGDYTDEHQMDTDTAVTDLEEMNALLDPFCNIVNLRLKGNHDHRPNAAAQTYRYIMAHSDDVVWGSRIGGYFYRDFPAYKMRIICLNTTEVARDNVSVSDAQYEFFVDTLDMSAKEDVAEWGILILSHHPLDWTVSSGACRFGNILNAYQTGGSWADGTISCNYENKNYATIVGNFHGHIHNLLTDKIYIGEPGNSAQTSVWRMCVPASRVDYVNHYNGVWQESSWYGKTPNTAEDTSFCIFCIDLDSHTIKAFCYGAGYDREVVYYEEQQEIVNIIDTVGYTNDVRYSASSHGTKTASGYVCTGEIQLSPGDILQTSGANFDAAEQQYCNVACIPVNNPTSDWTLVTNSGSMGDGGIYMTITIDAENNLTITGGSAASDIKIRLTGYGVGANLIVTKNQTIE